MFQDVSGLMAWEKLTAINLKFFAVDMEIKGNFMEIRTYLGNIMNYISKPLLKMLQQTPNLNWKCQFD
jgi:hypothetical protein